MILLLGDRANLPNPIFKTQTSLKPDELRVNSVTSSLEEGGLGSKIIKIR